MAAKVNALILLDVAIVNSQQTSRFAQQIVGQSGEYAAALGGVLARGRRGPGAEEAVP